MAAEETSTKTSLGPEVRVVEASAGSGKTFALAKRYVHLLLSRDFQSTALPTREILAITFTNKAAFEMKSRILEFLKKTALGKLTKAEEKELLTPVGLNRDSARERAFAVMQALIHNYNFFQVQTIDKFINALLSGCAFKIGLTANFRIRTNSAEYLEYSFDELIDRAASDQNLRGVFNEFLHNYLYLEGRTGWFPRNDCLMIMRNLFGIFNAYGLPFKESAISSEDIIKKKRLVLKDMNRLRDNLPEGTDKRFRGSLEKFLNTHARGFDIDKVSNYFARDAFPAKKGADVPSKVDRLWAKILAELTSLCEEEARSLFNPYIKVFDHVRSDFMKLSSRDDVLFLEELNKRAGLLFDDGRVTVEELYYRLATRFHHYLIDEFQDTSRLQWTNLQEMVREALSTGGTLFYVGDQKQAIYGFRGGEVELFEAIQRDFSPFGLKHETLNKNWRSHKAIVEFNNAVFSVDNLCELIHKSQAAAKKSKIYFSEEDIRHITGVFGSAQQVHRGDLDKGYVRMEIIDEKKKEDRDELTRQRLLDLIRDLKKRFAHKDIALLTRSNRQVEDLTNWLMEDGIPVESERTSNVREDSRVLEIVSFLKFLSSPIDNLAFADFVLGDIFTAASGIGKRELHDFIFSLRSRLTSEKDFYLYTEFRKVYKGAWESFIDEFFKNVGLYPLYELVVSIYSCLGCLEHFPAEQGFFMHFLEIIKKQEEEHTDIDSFLEYFENLEGEELFVHITDSDAVKIMTVHKSKGLEFPVVICPFLGMDVQPGAQSADNKQSYVLNRENGYMELLRLKSKYYDYSENLAEIYNREYKRELLNELNTAYVALTRAKCELYGFIPAKVQNKHNLIKQLIPEDQFEHGSPSAYVIEEEEKMPVERLGPSQYHDWIAYLKDEFMKPEEFANRGVRLKGDVIHCILSNINVVNKKNIDLKVTYGINNAKILYKNIVEWEEYEEYVKEMLNDVECAKFFQEDGSEVFTEKEVVNKRGEAKRIDRLMISREEVRIVDFKSSRSDTDDHHAQIREYMDIVRRMYPKKKVRGFLMYIFEKEVEEVEG